MPIRIKRSTRRFRQSINQPICQSVNPRARSACTAIAFVLAACGATQPGGLTQSLTRSHTSQSGMPCTEAARVTRGALLRLGYDGGVVTPPQPGVPGTVTGKKAGGFDAITNQASHWYTATVIITCSNAGAEFEAVTDEPLPGSLTFKTDFASAIRTVAERRVNRPRLAERPETGLVITVEPLRSSDASGEFGVDLPSAGVTPVRVKIDNRTERTYAFATDRVRLVTQEGERVEPLAPGAVATRLKTDPNALAQKQIGDGTLAPKAVMSGFLYFPASAYRRATVVLIDAASEEEEGFSVEF
jgi:hypothetical protein